MLRNLPSTVCRLHLLRTTCCQHASLRYKSDGAEKQAQLALRHHQEQQVQRLTNKLRQDEELQKYRDAMAIPPPQDAQDLAALPWSRRSQASQTEQIDMSDPDTVNNALANIDASSIARLDGSAFLAPTMSGKLMVAHRLKVYQGSSRHYLYRACSEDLDYMQFMRLCEMEDTLSAWFLILHLHLWMIMVRLRLIGKPGKKVTYHLVELMWTDMQARAKIIGLRKAKEKKEAFYGYQSLFHELNFTYDEAVLRDDSVLASALWNTFFYTSRGKEEDFEGVIMKNDNDNLIANVAQLVEYVRKNMQYLESIDSFHLMTCGVIKWLPLHDGIPIQRPEAEAELKLLEGGSTSHEPAKDS